MKKRLDVQTWATGKEKTIVAAKCRNKEDKEKIMENKKKLGKDRIYVDKDLIWNKRKMGEKVVELARHLRTTEKRVRKGYNNVSGENEEWIWNKKVKKYFHMAEDEEE